MPKAVAQPVVRVNLQLPPTMYNELRRLAAEANETMTAYIVGILTKAAASRKGAKP